MRALMLLKSASVIVSAAIASTTTTARGTITGSWRPLISSLQIFALTGDSGLRLADRWVGLMWHEDNITSVTHTTHDTSRMVGSLGNDAVFQGKPSLSAEPVSFVT